MAVYERVVFSQSIGALDAPTELVDNDSGDDSGPYQLTVTPGRAETAPAEIRLYDAARTVADTAVDTDANLLERFDVPFDGPRDVTVRVVSDGRKLWIASPDASTSGHRVTVDVVAISGLA